MTSLGTSWARRTPAPGARTQLPESPHRPERIEGARPGKRIGPGRHSGARSSARRTPPFSACRIRAEDACDHTSPAACAPCNPCILCRLLRGCRTRRVAVWRRHERRIRSRKVTVGGPAGLALGLGRPCSTRAVLEAQAEQAPQFEVDPFWPKPMPNNWVMGQTIGLAVDDRDHVWIIHRGNDPGNLDRTELAVRAAGHAARQRVLRPGAAGARVRRRPATSSATGAAPRAGATSGPSRTTASSSITRASSGSAATAVPTRTS